MSKKVKRFIERLKDYKSFELKEYECEKYNCEISVLLQNARNNDYSKECLEIWKKIYSNEFFELKHPIYNHIKTRAIANFLHPRFHINYILFADKEENHIWLTLQLHGIADCFIAEDTIYIEPFIIQWGFRNAMLGRIPQIFSFVKMEYLQSLSYQDIPFALCFDNIRPYHAFGDDVHWFLQLSMDTMDKEILISRAFFILKGLQICKTPSEKYVYIAPRLYFNADFSLVLNYILGEVYQDFNSLVAPQDKLDKFDKEQISESEIEKLSC